MHDELDGSNIASSDTEGLAPGRPSQAPELGSVSLPAILIRMEGGVVVALHFKRRDEDVWRVIDLEVAVRPQPPLWDDSDTF